MKTYVVFGFITLMQQALSYCLPAPCTSPPAIDLLLPPLPVPPGTCAPNLAALAPTLATTLSSSLSATLPPLLEAALPSVLTSALAAASPLLGAQTCAPALPTPIALPALPAAPLVLPAPLPCAVPSPCAPLATPIAYAAPAPMYFAPPAPSCLPMCL